MPRRKQTQADKMLRVMIKPDWTIDELMDDLRMTLEEVAAFLADDHNRSLLQSLRFMEDFRSQMTISRHRVTAAHRLLQMIREETFADKDREILRRACAELLRTKVMDDSTGGKLAMAMIAGDQQVSDIELLAALRRIGRDEPDDDLDDRLLPAPDMIDGEVVR